MLRAPSRGWRWLPFWSLLLCLRARPLPDKNELANACYFTYRVGYIICDHGLGPEEAQEAMEAGKCNKDFRLMASDFQRRVVQHYHQGGPPPLEEAMWLLTAPENFQARTLKECAPMQVMALLLMAEARIYTHGPRSAPAAQLAFEALRLAQEVPGEVYSALAKAWPMEAGLERYQQVSHTTRLLVEDHQKAQKPFKADVIFCRCEESLNWFFELLDALSATGDFAVSSYSACGAANDGRVVREVPAPTSVLGARSECSALGVLEHLAGVADGQAPFTLFLSSAEPQGSARHLLSLVLRSLAARTLDVPFLSLSTQRRALLAPLACDFAVWKGTFKVGLPCGYEGVAFLVSDGIVKDFQQERLHRARELLERPPAVCNVQDDVASFTERHLWAWHTLLTKEAWLPLRAEDERLPLFLRFADGPSGFQGTRMPKTSTYLEGVESTA